MGFQKTEDAKEVGLFFGMNDTTVRLWKSFCAVVSLVRTIDESIQETRDYLMMKILGSQPFFCERRAKYDSK